MAYLQRYDFTLDCSSGGAATVYSSGPVMGEIRQITYLPDGTSPLDTGADLTITGEVSGIAIATLTNIGTATATWSPRQATHTTAGAAALYAAAGVAVLDRIALAGERIKVVVAQGGVSLKGQLFILVG
jgi:hypothetical protein